MTTLDALLKKGFKCPCGGEIMTMSEPDAYAPHMRWYGVLCECGARTSIYHTSEVNAVVEWIVLTGGPIDGSIKPPEDIAILAGHLKVLQKVVYRDGKWYDSFEGFEVPEPEIWFFIYRDPSNIAAWLESEQ